MPFDLHARAEEIRALLEEQTPGERWNVEHPTESISELDGPSGVRFTLTEDDMGISANFTLRNTGLGDLHSYFDSYFPGET